MKATQGKQSHGWPAKARGVLQELNLILRIQPNLRSQPEAINPLDIGMVDLETTLLDQDTGKYSKDQINAILKALHFQQISLIQDASQAEADLSEV